MSSRERLRQILVLLVGVIALGTIGYQLIERWGFFDSLYMTVVTVSSVSFDSVHPLTRTGRWFTIGLIVVGRAIVLYAIGALTAFWVEGDLSHLWEKRRMERQIAALRDHIIVCGGGMPADKDNLFALMSAHELNPSIRIVSRAVAYDAGPKLLKAGAAAVVSVPTIGGLRLASAMVRPNVVDLLDAMLRAPGATRVEEVTVGRAAAGQTLGALKLQERTAVIVFALRDAATQRHVFNPPPERVLQAGDVLMGCADPEQVAALQRIVTEG